MLALPALSAPGTSIVAAALLTAFARYPLMRGHQSRLSRRPIPRTETESLANRRLNGPPPRRAAARVMIRPTCRYRAG